MPDCGAFRSLASNVLIENLIIEKYASPAQTGAIHSIGTQGWTIKNSEIRLNSGAGILVGNGARVVGCDLHPADLGRERLGTVARGRLAPERLDAERAVARRPAQLADPLFDLGE